MATSESTGYAVGDVPAAATSVDVPKVVVERSRKAMEPILRLKSKVVHGFGRGSKLLGFPTANMEVNWAVENDPDKLAALSLEDREMLDFARNCEAGIYYAWAQVSNGPDKGVYKAAMSVGWNPTFADVKAKTVEPWILHDFTDDFYDCELRLVVCGFVRPELKFDDFGELIVAIREDGEYCRTALDDPACVAFARDGFFVVDVPKVVVERSRKPMQPILRLKSKVVHGFGRGSKLLGFPTANMEVNWAVEGDADKLAALSLEDRQMLDFARGCEAGIYYAWAQVSNGPDRGVYKAAMSVGWNPTFADVKAKTVEPWILHDFTDDFYDCELRLVVCGFVRPELKFDDFGELIVAIREDGEYCRTALDDPACAALSCDSFFVAAAGKDSAAK